MAVAALLGIDAGTTGVRAVLVDTKGRRLADAYVEFPQHYPQPGWVEHHPEEIWEATLQTIGQARRAAGAHRLLGIGITNQRETTVLWDRRTGRPIANAIVWQCRRTTSRCQQLAEAGYAELVQQKTGLVLDPYFSATKLEWLLDRYDPDRSQCHAWAFGTVDTWLLWKLTGGRSHATDPTNASRTMLYHIDARAWDDELLELFRVPRSLLPEVRPSAGRFGETHGLEVLPDGVPIVGIAGDQQAALFGQTCFLAGEAKNTYGTGCFLLQNAGNQRPAAESGLLVTLACDEDGGSVYALEGSVFIGGAVVQWLRDQLGVIRSAAETQPLAESVPDTGGVIFVPAFTGLGAPYWAPEVRGALFGLTRGTQRAHIVRAALEAIAQQSADVVEAMVAGTGLSLPHLRVDGGACVNDFLMQFQADLLGVPVERPHNVETTVFGALGLAGRALNVWNADDLRALRRVDRVFQPSWSAADRERSREAWRQAVSRLLT